MGKGNFELEDYFSEDFWVRNLCPQSKHNLKRRPMGSGNMNIKMEMNIHLVSSSGLETLSEPQLGQRIS